MPRVEYVVPITDVKYDPDRDMYVITLRARRLGKPGKEKDVEITPTEYEQLGKLTAGDHIKVTLEKYL